MLVLGDVFAVVAVLLGLTLTSMALLLSQSLLYPEKARSAAARLNEGPMGRFAMGALVGIPTLSLMLIFASLPNPLVRTVGLLGVMGWVIFATSGLTGVIHVMAQRIRTIDAGVGEYAALVRATLILVGAVLLPFVGWLLIAPVALLTGFGLGLKPLRSRSSNAQFE